MTYFIISSALVVKETFVGAKDLQTCDIKRHKNHTIFLIRILKILFFERY